MKQGKVGLAVLRWYAAVAIPAVALSLLVVALLDDYMASWIQSLAGINWGALALEGSARWPEVVGMVVGMVVIWGLIIMERRRQTNG
ncbi:MAG: hypothetical protein PVI81_02510 [Anaerolineales bacterium]|jgi:hypothetical protein